MSRRDGGMLGNYVVAFLKLPLWCAPLGAAFIYVVLALVPGWAFGPHPSTMGLVVITALKPLAPLAAGLVLLGGLIGATNRAVDRVTRRGRPLGDPSRAEASSSMGAPATAAVPPACPRCGGMMVQRVARKGSNAGQAFWGCQGYPKCNGTVG